MDCGKRIRQMRLNKNMTSTELAKQLEVTQPYISQLERGAKVLSYPIAVQLAEIFGCKLEDFGRDDEGERNDANTEQGDCKR